LTVEAKNGVWIGSSPTGGYPILAAGNSLGVDDVRTSPTQSLISSNTDQTAASPGQIFILSGTGGISIIQSTIDADNAFIAMNNGPPNATVANIQITSSGGPVDLTGAMITAQTTGIDAGGNIGVSAQIVSVIGGSISASSNPVGDLAQLSNFPGGNAGAVSIMATGADPSSTVSALQIGGGANLSSTTNGVAATGTSAAVAAGNAGTIALTANLGTVQVGVPTDSLSAPNVISTSAGANAGQAGTISLTGKGISLTDTQLLTTVGTLNAVDASNVAYLPASVTLTGSGPVALTDTLIDARTSGAVDAGSVSISGTSVSITGGQQPATGGVFYGLPSNTAVFSATAGRTGNAGTISILADAGSLTVTDASIIAQSGRYQDAGGGIGAAGEIDLSGDNISLDDAALSTAMYSGEAATPSLIKLAAAKGGTVTLNGSIVDTTTSGAVAAGPVTITGTSIAITGGQQVNSGIADTILPTNTAIFSGTGGSGDAGIVTVSATGPLSVSNATISAQSGGGGGGGGAGVINLKGDRINLEGTTVSTVTESQLSTATPAFIAVTGIDGGAVTLDNSLLDSRTTGTVSAGAITVTGGSVSITGGPANGPVRGGEAGLPPVSANTAIFSDTSYAGDAGSITVAATASSIPSATGLVTITGAILSSQSEGNTGNGGTIKIVGSSVSIDPSTISTSTIGTGSAGDITITAAPGSLTLNSATIESASTSSAADAGAVGVIDLTGGSLSITNSLVSASTQGGTSPPTGTRSDPNAPPAIVINSGLAPALVIADSTISTSAAVSTGGNIEIEAGGSPLILNNATILASAGIGAAGTITGGGNGGNIRIDNAGNTVLAESGILAETPSGSGGEINIGLEPGSIFVQDSLSKVAADSGRGVNGTVTINSPQTNFNAALAAPEVSTAKKPEFAHNACQRDRNRSTFVREGRGGVAPAPDGYQTTLFPTQASTAVGTPPPPTTSAEWAATPILLAAATDVGCE